jgi:RNA polymerase sigma-70 factor (ECF subfamily)
MFGPRGNRSSGPLDERHAKLVHAVRLACEAGDARAIGSLLAVTVTAVVDGGGRVRAPTEPLQGLTAVTRWILRALAKHPALALSERSINGRAGLVLNKDGRVVGVAGFDTRAERITRIWIVLNPDKLRRWNLP